MDKPHKGIMQKNHLTPQQYKIQPSNANTNPQFIINTSTPPKCSQMSYFISQPKSSSIQKYPTQIRYQTQIHRRFFWHSFQLSSVQFSSIISMQKKPTQKSSPSFLGIFSSVKQGSNFTVSITKQPQTPPATVNQRKQN